MAFTSWWADFTHYQWNWLLPGEWQSKMNNKKRRDNQMPPPNIPHWHGASKDDELIQIAITSTEKGATVWLEKVTDEKHNK